jgi:CHAT domain-containing protein
VPDPDPLARGWRLKQACYEAWHRDPAAARAAAAELGALAADHVGEAVLQALAAWTAGIAALTEGRLPDALGQLQGAQARFRAEGDAAHAAETQVPQVMLLSILGRDAEAQACAEAARRQFLALGDERSAGKIELNLGNLLFRQDRHAEAEPWFRHAALRFARVGDAELSIMADGALAGALHWQFRLDEALAMFERVRLRAEARGLGLLAAQARQGLGQIELQRGRWHQALPALAAAAELAARHGAPPPRRLGAEAALADAYLAVNLLHEAVALYDRVIGDAAALPAPVEQAWATLQRARALGRLGDLSAAREGFAQAAVLYQAAGNRTVLGLVALARGRVELAAGDAGAALASAETALQSLGDTGIIGWRCEAEWLAASAQAARGDGACARAGFEALRRRAEGPPLLPQHAGPAWVGLGHLARERGDASTARAAYEAALAFVEQARAALPGDEWRSALAAEAVAAHEALVALAAAEGDAAATLVAMERGRARALALALDADGPVSDLPDEAGARLQAMRQRWQQLVAEGDDARSPGLAERIQALEHELLEAQRRARLQAAANGAEPAAAAGRPFDRERVADLQAALGPDCALLAYQRLGEQLLACVVTADGVQQHLWPAPDLDAQLRSLRFQLDVLRHGADVTARHGAQLQSRAQARLQALHQHVWAPVQPLLGGRRRVVLLPHRELHDLPFAALHDGQAWLVQTHELLRAPSAAVWLALQSRTTLRRDRALVLAAGGPGLPQVAAEAQAVAAALGGAVQLRLDEAATLAAMAAEAGHADLLHLACHGQFRADNPAFSHLELADGRLTLHEVAGLRLRASLVVLSACETGASRLAPGDELLGLVRAFLIAGAARVLATQWVVDDAATAALVGRFYRALAAGAAPAGALQQAQAEAAGAGQHPALWAAFALHGTG